MDFYPVYSFGDVYFSVDDFFAYRKIRDGLVALARLRPASGCESVLADPQIKEVVVLFLLGVMLLLNLLILVYSI